MKGSHPQDFFYARRAGIFFLKIESLIRRGGAPSGAAAIIILMNSALTIPVPYLNNHIFHRKCSIKAENPDRDFTCRFVLPQNAITPEQVLRQHRFFWRTGSPGLPA
jgi:hypothetical protein